MIWILSAWVVLALMGPSAQAQERLPLFDTHVHYNQDAWDVYSPQQILEKFAAAGVKRALVSSTPDDGTLKLYAADKNRIVPVLRPYRDGGDRSGWARNQEVFEYLSNRIRRGVYRGIGEFHLDDAGETASPQMKGLVRIAVQRNIVLQVHSGAEPVNVLFSHDPNLQVLWAHAGMSEPPNLIGKMLDKHSKLWVGLSFRESDIAPGGKIDQAWRALFLRHPDRFMFASDTYITERWSGYADIVAEHRAWISQLPREVAEKIAYRNAVRLFGAGKGTGLGE